MLRRTFGKGLGRAKVIDTVSGSLHMFATCASDLSCTTSTNSCTRVLAGFNTAPPNFGSGGFRLLAYNHAHAGARNPYRADLPLPTALLFNSRFDANARFFASVPQAGDALLYDEAIHASAHDGARASRVASHRACAALLHTMTRARCAPGALG